MSSKSTTAIASSTQLSAEAGAVIAREGGNAVDVAIAASLVAAVTEPGICAAGCGGFISLWPDSGDPLTIDGNIEMPGHSREPNSDSFWEVLMEYGGGVSTLVGHGSVGTPGGLAAYERAWQLHGKLPWKELFGPAIDYVRQGFPLSSASVSYLQYSYQCVYGWQEDTRSILQNDDGSLKDLGSNIIVPQLADSLDELSREGTRSFYQGDLARLIARDFDRHDAQLSAEDLAAYEVFVRKPIPVKLNDWHLATNPPPAVGGVSLLAMLELVKQCPDNNWSADMVARVADIQRDVLMHRYQYLDMSDQMESDGLRLLDQARKGAVAVNQSAPSTVHTSVVDNHGMACAITMSSGYGSGVMPPGTGMWMNNCVGETELNRKGFSGPAGRRLASNMAPTVGRHPDGHVLAIGSPGADRITSALLCTLTNFMRNGMSLEDAIAHPRLHVEINDGDPKLAYEAGLDVSKVTLPARAFDEPSMFFGGVGATLCTQEGELTAAADPRRAGGKVVA